jgi:hypothetical protein
MKNIGFVGLADATTFAGEVTVALSDGLEIVSGKSFDAEGGGSCAGGAGSGLVLGDHVIGTGGAKGAAGCEGAGVLCDPLTPPQPTNSAMLDNRIAHWNWNWQFFRSCFWPFPNLDTSPSGGNAIVVTSLVMSCDYSLLIDSVHD